MKLSRETCLHCESIIPLGMGYAIETAGCARGLFSVPLAIHLINFEEGHMMSKKLITLFLCLALV